MDLPMPSEGGADLTSIVDAAPAGVLVVTREGSIVYVNAALEAMFGYTREQLLGTNIELLLPLSSRDSHGQFLEMFFTSPRPRAMGAGRLLFARRADGMEFPIEAGLGMVRHLGMDCAVAFIIEASHQRELEVRFSKVVSSLPVGLLLVDGQGRILMTNPALDLMFGYGPGELLGEEMEKLIPPRLRRGHPALRDGFFKAPSLRVIGSGRDLTAAHRDEREFPVEIGLTQIEMTEGRQILAVITDISPRKKYESELTEINAQLEEFTYIASHDLRTPLRGIGELLGWIREEIGEAHLTDAIRHNFERALLRVHRAERMIDDMLEYARAGQRANRAEMIDPRTLIEEALIMAPPPEGFAVHVEVTAPPFETAGVPLGSALRNLLGNAFKHHGGTQGAVQVSVHEEGQFYAFSVEDDGAGVPEGEEERIFKLFHRSTTKTPGHGVGLAVTRRIVTSHGGSIALSRSPSLGGACFRILWPRHALRETE